jgi:hypothetical protein
MVAVAVLACGMAYVIGSTRPQYSESADVILSLPGDQTAPNAYYIYASSLITSEEAIIQDLTGPQGQRRIRSAGGTAVVGMQLLNLYNQEYPEYPEPLATLTSAAPSADGAHRSFVIATRLLTRILGAWQARAGVPPRSRISAEIVADTGPVAQAGSPKRGLAGLALLAVLAASAVWNSLERRPAWPALAASRRAGSIPAARTPAAAAPRGRPGR